MATASGSSDLAVASWSEPEGHPSKSDRYLARRLAAASADYKGVVVTTFLLAACVAAMAWILFGIGLEHWMIAGGLPRWARWTWFVAGLAALAAAIVRWIVPLLRYRVNLVYAARAIEADHPELHNDLVNAVLVKARPDGAAAKVVRSLERRAAKRLARVPNDGVVDRTAAFRLALALAALVVGAGIYELTAPKSLLVSGARLIAPWAGLAAPTRVTIGPPRLSWRQPGAAPQAGGDPEGRVFELGGGGSATLVRGRQLIVSSEIRGLRTGENPTLVVGPIREDGAIDEAAVWRMPMVPIHRGPNGGADGDPGPSATGRSARGVRHLVVVPDAVRGLEEDVEFFISAGDARSDRVRISIVDTPSLLVREVRYEYPAYTRREPETVAWQGDLRAVEGTRATIVAEGNRPLESAWIDLDCDGKRDVELRVGQHDLTRATGTFRLQLKKDRSGPEHGSYRLVFQPIAPQAQKSAAAREEPVVEKLEHRIEVLPDLPPEVSIEEPREPVLTVPPGAPVEVRVRATDPDFALAGVAVETRLRGGAAPPPLPLLTRVHAGVFRGAVRIVPETLGAVPGSVLEYRANAVDTRQDLPNKTASPWQALRIDPSAPPPRQPPPRDGANQPRQGGEAAAGANPSDKPPGKPGQEEGRQSADESAENQSRGGPSGPEGRQDPKAATQGRQNGDQGDRSQKNDGSQSEDRQSQLPQKQDSRNQDPQKKDAEKNQDQKHTDKNSKDQQGQGPGASSQKSESEQAQSGGQGDDGKGQGGADAKGAENKAGEQGGGKKSGGENKAADSQAGENNAAENKAAENKDGSAGQAGGGKAAGGKQAGGKESGGKETGGQQTADNAGGGKAGGKQAADGRGAERGQAGGQRGGGDRAAKPQDTVAADGTNDGEAMERILDHRRKQEEASRQGGGKPAGGEAKKPGAESGAKSDGPNEKPAPTSEKNEQGKAGDKPESAQQTAAQKPAACADAQGKPCGKQGCSSCGGGSKSNGGGSGSSGAAGGRDGQSQQDGKDQQGQSQGQNQGQQGQGQQGQGQQGQGRDGQGKQGQGQPGQGQQGQGQQGQGEQGQADAGQGSGQKQEGQPGQAEGRGGEGQSQAGKSGEGRPGAPGREQSADGKQGDGKQGDGKQGDGKQGDGKQGDGRPGQSAKGQGNTAQQQGGGGQQPGPGKDQAGGDRAGQDQAGQQQAGKEQPGKGQTGKPGGDQAGDRAAEPGQGKSPASGDHAEGQTAGKSNAAAAQQPDGTQPAAGSQVGAGGRTGGRGGSGADGVDGPPPDRELEWTSEDLAHARNAADLAIEHLRDSVESGRRDVLDALGWTPEQARAFLERWQAMRRSAGSSDPRQRGEFEQTLRSLGLRPGGARNTRDVPTDVQGGQAEGRRSRPPASYREQLKAYLRGTSGE